MIGRGLAFAVALAAVFIAAKSARLDRPWTVGHDQMGARYSTIARNFVRDGVGLPIRQFTDTGRAIPSDARITTHPPAVPLLVAAAFAVTGTDAPWVARLVAILGAALALGLVWRLCVQFASRRVAAAAVLVVAIAPASAFYGAWVDPVGWWSIAAVLAVLVAYGRGLAGDTTPRAADVAWLASAIVIAMAIEWNAVFLAPLLAVDAVLRARPGAMRTLLAIGIAGAVTALLYRYGFALGGSEGATPFAKLARVDQWTVGFAATLVGYWVRLLGEPLAIAAALATGALLVRCVRTGADAFDRIAIVLLGFQAYYTAVYPIGSRVHDFCSLYLVVPVGLLVGRSVIALHDRLRTRHGRGVAAVTVGLALLGVGLHAAWLGLRGWAEHDRHAHAITAFAAVARSHTSPGEVVATTVPVDRLESVRYHADRAMAGGITTGAMLATLADGPHHPALFVLPRADRLAYPALTATLDAHARRTPIDRDLWLYDLRGTDARTWPDPADRDGRPRLAPPRDVTIAVDGTRVTIDWRPPTGVTPSGYRIDVGDAPGRYPVGIDVAAPPVTRTLPGDGRIHVVIAARGPDGVLGRRTADHGVTLRATPDRSRALLAIAIAVTALALLHAALLARARAPLSRPR